MRIKLLLEKTQGIISEGCGDRLMEVEKLRVMITNLSELTDHQWSADHCLTTAGLEHRI